MSDNYVRTDYGNREAEKGMLCVNGENITAEEYIALCERDPALACDVYETIKSWLEDCVNLGKEPKAFSCYEYFYTNHDDTGIQFRFYDEDGAVLWDDCIEDIGGDAAELYAAFLLKLHPVPAENIKYNIFCGGYSDRYRGLYAFLNRLNPNGNK